VEKHIQCLCGETHTVPLWRNTYSAFVEKHIQCLCGETHTVPLWRNLKQRVCLKDVGVGKRIILKWILKG